MYSTYQACIDIHANNDEAFCAACETTNFELILWLYYEIGNINLHEYGDRPYNHVCKSNVEIAHNGCTPLIMRILIFNEFFDMPMKVIILKLHNGYIMTLVLERLRSLSMNFVGFVI
jgi:hypothetical protein